MALSLQRYTSSDFETKLNSILRKRRPKNCEERQTFAAKFAAILPETLIIEILSWLPVKTLLQFKSVCKSWYDIITSSYFTSKHLHHYYNNNDDNECLLVHNKLSYAELYLLEFLDETPTVLAHAVLHDMPMYCSYMCGPCDGMYYLYLEGENNTHALWNPAINEFKRLPPIIENPNLPSNLFCATNEVCGFGYDPSIKDYKVVVIQGCWTKRSDYSRKVAHPLVIFIYSLRTNSWRYWGDLAHDYELEINKCYIFVSGCFYWLESIDPYRQRTEVIICFNLATEECHEISVPNNENLGCKSLGIYYDTIAILCVYQRHFNIWAMNDGLWIKKFTMGPIPVLYSPVGHWKNNKFLLQHKFSGILVLCDTDTQEIMEIKLKRGYCEAFVYKESLVSFKGQE